MGIVNPDSPFMRLPPQVNRRQAVFIDGIRHAAELTDLAYTRLIEELTEIAVQGRRGVLPTGPFTAPFLYAWAVVDGIYRLRGLLHVMPGLERIPRSDGEPGFHVKTEGIRSLRNVADHLEGRVDYLVSRNATALGTLSWVTTAVDEPGRFLSCAIVPGTLASGQTPLINPAESETIHGPSDIITLSAGEYSASLSEAMAEVRRVVKSLEDGLDVWIKEAGLTSERAGADMLVMAVIELVDD